MKQLCVAAAGLAALSVSSVSAADLAAHAPAPPPASDPAPARAGMTGDAFHSSPSAQKVLAPRTVPAGTTPGWPVVSPAPVLDEGDGHPLAPPLRGGPVPAFGATWHGSGEG